MRTFDLVGSVTISIYTRVEADTLEEAIEIAKEREIETAQFRSEEQEKEVWISDDYDGTPVDIKEIT